MAGDIWPTDLEFDTCCGSSQTIKVLKLKNENHETTGFFVHILPEVWVSGLCVSSDHCGILCVCCCMCVGCVHTDAAL